MDHVILLLLHQSCPDFEIIWRGCHRVFFQNGDETGPLRDQEGATVIRFLLKNQSCTSSPGADSCEALQGPLRGSRRVVDSSDAGQNDPFTGRGQQ